MKKFLYYQLVCIRPKKEKSDEPKSQKSIKQLKKKKKRDNKAEAKRRAMN